MVKNFSFDIELSEKQIEELLKTQIKEKVNDVTNKSVIEKSYGGVKVRLSQEYSNVAFDEVRKVINDNKDLIISEIIERGTKSLMATKAMKEKMASMLKEVE